MNQTFLISGRVLVWFSCGAASAVAAKVTLEEYPDDEVHVLYNDLFASEHPDNRRFLADVERWIGRPIEITRSEKYATIWDVFRGERFIVGKDGAPCTRALKRDVRLALTDRWDWNVFGFTADESARIDRFEDNNPELRCLWPLRERGITKRDCFGMLRQAGIRLPEMYRLGYRNNNCIGCVKGGAGYWNKVRVDFPAYFDRMNAISRQIGHPFVKHKGRFVYLDELPPDAGRYESEPDIECGPACVQAGESGT